jgi:hypothetical protein
VACTKATTIDGLIAQLRFLLELTEHVEIIVAGPRDIQRGTGGPAEPEVIGFGEPDER